MNDGQGGVVLVSLQCLLYTVSCYCCVRVVLLFSYFVPRCTRQCRPGQTCSLLLYLSYLNIYAL